MIHQLIVNSTGILNTYVGSGRYKIKLISIHALQNDAGFEQVRPNIYFISSNTLFNNAVNSNKIYFQMNGSTSSTFYNDTFIFNTFLTGNIDVHVLPFNANAGPVTMLLNNAIITLDIELINDLLL